MVYLLTLLMLLSACDSSYKPVCKEPKPTKNCEKADQHWVCREQCERPFAEKIPFALNCKSYEEKGECCPLYRKDDAWVCEDKSTNK